ncbi:MAG: hypothetical protein AAGD25_11240 [Cyanobacteria bacterium P01_F01_bin.150]
MSLYAIGIGGTGAKCLEALTQVASVGLLNQSNQQVIHTLFVDADETNGSLERSRSTMRQYQQCYDLFEKGRSNWPWMNARLRPLGLWSPLNRVTTDKKLGSLFGYDTLKQTSPEMGSLFEVLFTSEEREADLEVGFRGRPAIGSAVMSQIDLDSLDEEVWRQFIERIRQDAGGGRIPKIVLFGSIFGGTGASGLPTIGRLLHEKLMAENLRSRVSLACVFALPYFNFTPDAGMDKDEVYARSDQFLLNTEAALRYYLSQAQTFNTVYVLGDHNTTEVSFSLGKQTQRNPPHFIELYAALAARHLCLDQAGDGSTQVALVSRQNINRLDWRDLPDSAETKSLLGTTARFAYVWLANIAPELNQAKQMGIKSFQSSAPWFSQFFQSTSLFGRRTSVSGDEFADFNDPQEQKSLSILTEWCLDYLRWLSDISRCGDEIINLFKPDCLVQAKGTETIPDELSALVIGVEVDRSKRTSDSIPLLKQRLDDPDLASWCGRGMVGLARAIYTLCQI